MESKRLETALGLLEQVGREIELDTCFLTREDQDAALTGLENFKSALTGIYGKRSARDGG